jgi:aminoglycoside phosphotransferase (APT) family kinase protein
LARELARAEPRLLHMSDIMHNGNLIVREGRIVAIVDYVESMAGDPRWELAWFDYYFATLPFDRAPFDMARFRAAYGTDHDPQDDLGRFYLLAILVFEKLLWLDSNSEQGQWAIETVKDMLRTHEAV